jgi:hypothetical protein
VIILIYFADAEIGVLELGITQPEPELEPRSDIFLAS